MNIRVLKTNGQEVILKPAIHKDGNKTIVSISKEIVGEAEYVDFLYDYFNACEKDEGYYVLPFECVKGISLCYFKKREDTEYVSDFSQTYCYGMKNEDKSFETLPWKRFGLR